MLHSHLGTVEFDGSQMMFEETVSNTFERAGFDTTRVYRRDASNQHRHQLRSVTASIMGVFSFLNQIEMSAASTAFNHTPALPGDPFGSTDVLYMVQTGYFECDYHECEKHHVSDGTGAVLLPPKTADIKNYQESFAERKLYITRRYETYARKINDVWYSYTETSYSEYDGAVRVELSAVVHGDSDEVLGTSTFTQRFTRDDDDDLPTYGEKFYCTKYNATEAQDRPPHGLSVGVADNDDSTSEGDADSGESVFTFAGVSRFLDGRYTRMYMIHQEGEDPFDMSKEAEDNVVMPYFETIGDNTVDNRRMYSVLLDGHATWALSTIEKGDAAKSTAFAAIAEKFVGTMDNADATVDDYLDTGRSAAETNPHTGPCTTHSNPESIESALEDTNLAVLDAPPPLDLIVDSAFDKSAFVYGTAGRKKRSRSVVRSNHTKTRSFPGDHFSDKSTDVQFVGNRDRRSCDNTWISNVGYDTVSGEVCDEEEIDLGFASFETSRCYGGRQFLQLLSYANNHICTYG